MKISQAVTFNLECAHLSPTDSRLHGHSYTVQVWTDQCGNLVDLDSEVSIIKNQIDHSYLNDSIGGTTMEELGAFILNALAHVFVKKVVVMRPTLGFLVEVLAD